MAAPDIVLHEWAISPFCVKVRKVLALKGLSYRRVGYNGLRALEAKKLTKPGKLPVLDYDGERFHDSSLIVRVLDERHPTPPIYPRRAADRHLCHLLEDWADESLYFIELWARLCDPVALPRMVALLCEGRPSYESPLLKFALGRERKTVVAQGIGRYSAEHVEAQLRAHVEALGGLLEAGPWLAGPDPSIADIAVASQLQEIVRTSPMAHHITSRPALAAWLERCRFDGD